MPNPRPKKRTGAQLLPVRRITDGDRIALASTALAVLHLPIPMQQYSNARDMLNILAGKPCWRGGYILAQAHHVLNTYSGFRPNGHNEFDWDKCDERRADVEELVAKALAKRRELIAEDEAFRASDEGKALIASFRESLEPKAEKTA
jgi:hypothetical protein